MKDSPEYQAVRNSMTREQWILATVLIGTIKGVNAPFCGEDDFENDKDYMKNVATIVAAECSYMQVDDMQIVLNAILAKRAEFFPNEKV